VNHNKRKKSKKDLRELNAKKLRDVAFIRQQKQKERERQIAIDEHMHESAKLIVCLCNILERIDFVSHFTNRWQFTNGLIQFWKARKYGRKW
jgi:hypothetical protein